MIFKGCERMLRKKCRNITCIPVNDALKHEIIINDNRMNLSL